MKPTKIIIISLIITIALSVFSACENNENAEKARPQKVTTKETESAEKDTSETENPDLIVIGDCQALYKDSELTVDSDGEDAIIIRFEFTNNSNDTNSFAWAFFYDITQGQTMLEPAVVWANETSFDTLDVNEFEDIDPGETIEVVLTYKLIDTETPIKLAFSNMLDSEYDILTIDLKG